MGRFAAASLFARPALAFFASPHVRQPRLSVLSTRLAHWPSAQPSALPTRLACRPSHPFFCPPRCALNCPCPVRRPSARLAACLAHPSCPLRLARRPSPVLSPASSAGLAHPSCPLRLARRPSPVLSPASSAGLTRPPSHPPCPSALPPTMPAGLARPPQLPTRSAPLALSAGSPIRPAGLSLRRGVRRLASPHGRSPNQPHPRGLPLRAVGPSADLC